MSVSVFPLQYFPDRFVRREILNLAVICPFSERGCNWEGRYEELQQHMDICDFVSSTCEHCGETLSKADFEAHRQTCPQLPKPCPLADLGCTMPAVKQRELQQHLETSHPQHMSILASRVQFLEKRLETLETNDADRNQSLSVKIVESDGAALPSIRQLDSGFGTSLKSMPPSKTQYAARLEDVNTSASMPLGMEKDMHTVIESLVTKRVTRMWEEKERTFTMQLKEKDEEIATLKANVTKMEKTIRSKSAEQDDRDFRLSLIENGNHDGSMIWKIPQFSQRKADAENGKYTSIFSLPFYSGRYGYKMCLRLYIMGDGIGKGTHLSLFFVVMRGEFDNILQWPFTHKVTFKLINQAGGRDIVDTFQPDPLSSSFKKPTSDMNIASGCPRFVSHTELERGGFIVDDTVFIKCIINTVSIRHP